MMAATVMLVDNDECSDEKAHARNGDGDGDDRNGAGEHSLKRGYDHGNPAKRQKCKVTQRVAEAVLRCPPARTPEGGPLLSNWALRPWARPVVRTLGQPLLGSHSGELLG